MKNVKKGDFVKFDGNTYRVASRRGDGVLELADYWGKIVEVLPETDTRLAPGKESDMAANSRVRNAKFKVGDKVKYTGRDALVYGKTGSVGTVKYVDNVLFGGKCPLYEVEFPESPGDTDTISEERLRLANSAVRSTNTVVQNALNARTARNATKLMTLVPSKDGNKLNDFIHYAYFTADGKWKEGDIPYVRKDMLIRGLERELEKAKTTMQAISDAIKQAKEI